MTPAPGEISKIQSLSPFMLLQQCQESAWLNYQCTAALSKRFGAIKNSRIRRDEIGTISLRLEHVSSILSDVFNLAVSGEDAFDLAKK